jgi:uncharacterized cupin superfamily protein
MTGPAHHDSMIVEPLRPPSASAALPDTSRDAKPRERSEDTTMTSAIQNIDKPHETRPFREHGQMDVVTLGDFTVGRGTFEPGWRWSEDVKPIAGTDSCQVRHTGFCLSGHMLIRADDGTEITIGPGDVMILEPGHDAWTLGDEACVLLDTSVAAYAKAH